MAERDINMLHRVVLPPQMDALIMYRRKFPCLFPTILEFKNMRLPRSAECRIVRGLADAVVGKMARPVSPIFQELYTMSKCPQQT